MNKQFKLLAIAVFAMLFFTFALSPPGVGVADNASAVDKERLGEKRQTPSLLDANHAEAARNGGNFKNSETNLQADRLSANGPISTEIEFIDKPEIVMLT